MQPQGTKIICAGAIVLVQPSEGGKLKVLGLVREQSGRLEIGPKGGVRRGEYIADCAAREAHEELGFRVDIDAGQVFTTNVEPHQDLEAGMSDFGFGTTTIHYFLARISEEQLKSFRRSEEHVGYQLLGFEEMMMILNRHSRTREVNLLKKVQRAVEHTSE